MQNSSYGSASDKKNMLEGWFDTSMPDMNLDNPFVLQYFKQWAVWIIEWADLDGLRVDTFPYNEKEPISEWCAAIRKEYPNINIVGEVWTNNIAQLSYWQDDHQNQDGYDSNLPCIMDFPLQSALSRFNVDTENWEEGTAGIYESIANDIYIKDPQNIMVFSSNHDTDRISDVLEQDPRKLKLVMTLIGTVRGIPQIFAGDEYLQVSRDRSQGHGGLRVEFDENWAQKSSAKEVHDFCKSLFNWRRTSKAVQQGKTVQYLTRNNCFGYFRIAEDEAVYVFINNSLEPKCIPWEDYKEISVNLPGQGRNVISGEIFDPATCIVEAKSSIIIEFK